MLSIIIILVHVLVTHLCYRDSRFYTLYDPFWGLPIVGFSFFAPLRKWTFGAGYNHQAVVREPFFKTWTTSPYYCYLVFTMKAN